MNHHQKRVINNRHPVEIGRRDAIRLPDVRGLRVICDLRVEKIVFAVLSFITGRLDVRIGIAYEPVTVGSDVRCCSVRSGLALRNGKVKNSSIFSTDSPCAPLMFTVSGFSRLPSLVQERFPLASTDGVNVVPFAPVALTFVSVSPIYQLPFSPIIGVCPFSPFSSDNATRFCQAASPTFRH